jgi:hypothetical protein
VVDVKGAQALAQRIAEEAERRALVEQVLTGERELEAEEGAPVERRDLRDDA